MKINRKYRKLQLKIIERKRLAALSRINSIEQELWIFRDR